MLYGGISLLELNVIKVTVKNYNLTQQVFNKYPILNKDKQKIFMVYIPKVNK